MLTLWKRFEFLKPQPYLSKTEGAIAVCGTILWFVALLVRHQLPGAGEWYWHESLLDASAFVIFAAIPIFGLATPTGERLMARVLLPRQGLMFQLLLCFALALYIGLGKIFQVGDRHFSWVPQFNILVVPGAYWLNVMLFLGGVFVALRLPFIVQSLRQPQASPHLFPQLYGLLVLNTLYLSLHYTGTAWEGFAVSVTYGLICMALTQPSSLCPPSMPGERLTPSDFGLMVLCVAILYWFSIPSFNFGVFMGVTLFIGVMVYGSGLGRSHFGYSFVLRPQDVPPFALILVAAILVLVPVALGSGFVQPALLQDAFSPLKLAVYFTLFTFRVGIFEEVFFRSGLMVLLRDCWISKGRSPWFILWGSIFGCSLLFGITHLGNDSGANTLPLCQYRGLYLILATVASLFYSLGFAKTNRLAVPILVHGVVDTIAVVLLGGSLAVPF